MKKASLFTAILFLHALAATTFGQGHGEGNRITIKSEVLGEERVILVRTPPGYERNGQRYPALYLTDGDAHLAHTSSVIEYLWRNGRMPELIVVAITNTDRTRDLTPTSASMKRPDGNEAKLPTSGGADKFLKFIETELIPKIEKDYRTQPYRVFAGHSFGGLFAIHAFLTRPEVFNAYIAVSPTMQWDNHLLSRKAEEFFKDRKELNRTLYFTLANEGGDARVGFDRFKTILGKNKPKGFEWGSMLMEDEDHGSVVMPSHYQGLRKVFEGWQVTAEIASGGASAVEGHYKSLSAKFGYPILPPELLMNQLGYQLIGSGKMDDAIAVFKSNVDRYPNSANVYDSLAEAYENSGKLDLARPNYEKAVQLGAQNNDPNLQVYKTNFERVDGLLKKTAEVKGK
ncbi:MAG TPA: alpha/beta hydrolase-fold protein [Blastocatellia bacterium]|nr:alpha/beta hydrolase-fold protein [Blastocatellia bacterium]